MTPPSPSARKNALTKLFSCVNDCLEPFGVRFRTVLEINLTNCCALEAKIKMRVTLISRKSRTVRGQWLETIESNY